MPKAAAIFITGGTLYTLTELIWRGHSHWSMGICGGLCFSLMYLISALPMSRLRIDFRTMYPIMESEDIRYRGGCLCPI